MEKTQLINTLKRLLPDIETTDNKQFLEVTVPSAKLHAFANELKNDSSLAFDYVFCLTSVDQQTHFTVVYHLESTRHLHQLVVKVNLADREDAMLDSVSDLWITAEFHEREIYDLMGIRFNNHPDLRRLFLEDGWGFPLRKDYKDDINMIER